MTPALRTAATIAFWLLAFLVVVWLVFLFLGLGTGGGSGVGDYPAPADRQP